MNTRRSVTELLVEVQRGSDEARMRLYRRCWPTIVEVARQKFNGSVIRQSDEENVARRAFWSFFQALQAGEAPRLANRFDFLAMVVHIVAREGARELSLEDKTRLLDGAPAAGSSCPNWQEGEHDEPNADLGTRLVSEFNDEPSADERAALERGILRLTEVLPEKYHPYAQRYLAGLDDRQIAEELGTTAWTVERKLGAIREIWQRNAARELTG